MRREHAVNDGKIFSWDNPPPTGNPGEAFGCRCWAEAYKPAAQETVELQERVSQVVTYAAPDVLPAWAKRDFIKHYFLEKGRAITLHEIGLLQIIISALNTTAFKNVAEQILDKARQKGAGAFTYKTENSYELRPIVFSIGGATVKSNSQVSVEQSGQQLVVTADIEYDFYDVYTDVFSINEILEWLGEKETIQLTGLMLGMSILGVNSAFKLFEKIKKEMNLPDEMDPNDIGEWDLPGSVAFEITDKWSTRLDAVIKK